MIHLEILDEKRIQLLKELDRMPFIKDFSLGGGTSLSLRLGLRESYDFDFFASSHFNPEILLNELKDHFHDRLKLIEETTSLSTLNLYIDEVQVSFFEYRYKVLDSESSLEGFENIRLLSIPDIACMKSIAILQRGSKKDFYDLYFILQNQEWDSQKLKEILFAKYSEKNLWADFCYSIGYFADAEEETLPKSFVDYSWDDIKQFFLKMQTEFVK